MQDDLIDLMVILIIVITCSCGVIYLVFWVYGSKIRRYLSRYCQKYDFKSLFDCTSFCKASGNKAISSKRPVSRDRSRKFPLNVAPSIKSESEKPSIHKQQPRTTALTSNYLACACSSVNSSVSSTVSAYTPERTKTFLLLETSSLTESTSNCIQGLPVLSKATILNFGELSKEQSPQLIDLQGYLISTRSSIQTPTPASTESFSLQSLESKEHVKTYIRQYSS